MSDKLNKLNKAKNNSWMYMWVLIQMSRPSQLLAIVLVSVWGCTVAIARSSAFTMEESLMGFLALILNSISIHYANEYADYETDRLTIRTPFSGGSGALPNSIVPRKFALRSAWVVLALGATIAAYGFTTKLISPNALVILMLGTFLGWMYSLKPLALAWRGFGEITNAVLGGILLPAYAYTIHFKTIDWIAILSFMPFGMLVFTNLLATTWPDRKADASVGKFTLATRWPVKRLRMVYTIVAIGAILVSLALINVALPPLVVFSGLFATPTLIWSISAYTRIFSPLPSVAAMVFFLVAQLTGWLIIIYPNLMHFSSV